MLRKPEVQRRTSMGKTQLGEAIRRGIFPKGVPIFEGGRALGWFEDEVESYVESRRQARDAAAAAAPRAKIEQAGTVAVAVATPKKRGRR
jgi:predicted DNA-binding transcriptional regulator AlpA